MKINKWGFAEWIRQGPFLIYCALQFLISHMLSEEDILLVQQGEVFTPGQSLVISVFDNC